MHLGVQIKQLVKRELGRNQFRVRIHVKDVVVQTELSVHGRVPWNVDCFTLAMAQALAITTLIKIGSVAELGMFNDPLIRNAMTSNQISLSESFLVCPLDEDRCAHHLVLAYIWKQCVGFELHSESK